MMQFQILATQEKWPYVSSDTIISTNTFNIELANLTLIYVDTQFKRNQVSADLPNAAANIWKPAWKLLQHDQTFDQGVTHLQKLVEVHTQIQDMIAWTTFQARVAACNPTKEQEVITFFQKLVLPVKGALLKKSMMTQFEVLVVTLDLDCKSRESESINNSASEQDVQLSNLYVQLLAFQGHVDTTLLTHVKTSWMKAWKLLDNDTNFVSGITDMNQVRLDCQRMIHLIADYNAQMTESRRLLEILATQPWADTVAAVAEPLKQRLKAPLVASPKNLQTLTENIKTLRQYLSFAAREYDTFETLSKKVMNMEYPSITLQTQRDRYWAKVTFDQVLNDQNNQILPALQTFITQVQTQLTEVDERREALKKEWIELGSLSPQEETEHNTMVLSTNSLTLLADRMPALVHTLERVRLGRRFAAVQKEAHELIAATGKEKWVSALRIRISLISQLQTFTATEANLSTLQSSVEQLRLYVEQVTLKYPEYVTRVQALNTLECPSQALSNERTNWITEDYKVSEMFNVTMTTAIDAFITQVNDRVKTLQARQSAIKTEYKALKALTPKTDTAKKLEAELLIHTIPDLEARVAQLEALLTTVRKEVQQQQTPAVDHQREQLALQLYQHTLQNKFPDVFKRADTFTPTAFTDLNQPNQKAATHSTSIYVPIPLVIRREIAAHIFYRSIVLLDIPLAPAAGQSIVVALRHIFQDPALITTVEFDRYQPAGIRDRLTGLFVAPPRMYTLEQATHILSNHHVYIFRVQKLADDDNDNDTLLGLLVQGPSHVYAILRFKQVWIQVDTVSVAEGGARHPLVLATKEIQDLVAKSIPVWAVAVSPSAFWQQPTLTNPHAIPWVRAEAQIPPVITTNLPQLPNILATMLKETQQK